MCICMCMSVYWTCTSACVCMQLVQGTVLSPRSASVPPDSVTAVSTETSVKMQRVLRACSQCLRLDITLTGAMSLHSCPSLLPSVLAFMLALATDAEPNVEAFFAFASLLQDTSMDIVWSYILCVHIDASVRESAAKVGVLGVACCGQSCAP